MANSQVKMKRARVNARHLDQHISFPVFARHERSGEEFWWRCRGNLKQCLSSVCHALDRHVPIDIGTRDDKRGLSLRGEPIPS